MIIMTIIIINYRAGVWDISQSPEAGLSALGPCGICTQKCCQQLRALRGQVQHLEVKVAGETERGSLLGETPRQRRGGPFS